MQELKIENYQEQLRDVCKHCNRLHVCKNHEKICFTKKFVFAVAKREYKKRQKEGLINECD